MQTFLPYASFRKSAECLDYRRLGKQRVECKQILLSLYEISDGWKNHPATKMWKGYEAALCGYGLAICAEWIIRGYKDNCISLFENTLYNSKKDYKIIPPWLGNKEFHNAHKSNLLRKNKEFYSQYNWKIPDNLEYIWPV